MNVDNEYLAYLVHLREEHEALHRKVQCILKCLADGQAAADHAEAKADMRDRLRELQTCLQFHFREEEEGGCLEEAVSRCPSLYESYRELEAEHRELAEQLDRLVAGLEKTPATAVGLQALEAEFRAFADKLLAHEADENLILQHGFNEANSPDDPI